MKIIHIKQAHRNPFDSEHAFENKPDNMEVTLQSQFQVAQELRKLKGCPVVDESFFPEHKDAKFQPVADIAKKIFPEGFPDAYHKLTSLQKDFLYDIGASHTLFYLDEIPSIYKCTHTNGLDGAKELLNHMFNFIKNNPRDEKRELCLLSKEEENNANINQGKIYIRPAKNGLEYAVLDNDNKTINRNTITAAELGIKINENLNDEKSDDFIKKCKPKFKKILKILHNRNDLKEVLPGESFFKSPEVNEFTHDSREKEAIECAKEAAIQHFGSLENAPQVIIVYGAAHDFKPYCDKEGFEHETIDTLKPIKTEKLEVASNPSGFYSRVHKRFDTYLKDREIKKELEALVKKGLYY